MTANRQKVNAARKAIARALDAGSLSKDLLQRLERKIGLEATQEAAAACWAALEDPQEVRSIEKCIGFLFSEKTIRRNGLFVDREGELRPLVEMPHPA